MERLAKFLLFLALILILIGFAVFLMECVVWNI
jgi:hypothetical protein